VHANSPGAGLDVDLEHDRLARLAVEQRVAHELGRDEAREEREIALGRRAENRVDGVARESRRLGRRGQLGVKRRTRSDCGGGGSRAEPDLRLDLPEEFDLVRPVEALP
jgi:hypothetical protein